MIQKLTITYIKREGRVSPRTNKPYTSLTLKAKEHGDRYLSGFDGRETSGWKEGDVIEVEVTESEKMDKQNRPYLNWKLIDKEAQFEARLKKLEDTMAKFTARYTNSDGSLVPNFNVDPDLDEANAELDAIADEEMHDN